ncbi:MAG: HEAT repeat domain-containing protein [Ignavibacteriales bacterium]|nr:HEAT repeat domain-containing protein [Ignavibacteriales bacterium]
MKRSVLVTLALVLAVALTTSAFARTDKQVSKPAFQMEVVEANLVIGVNSSNFGLRVSAANMLGDIKSPNGVFALMQMLRNETDERGRIVAALALIKIGDPVGIYAVKQTGRLDGNDRVRKLCALFYQEYQQQENI